MIWVDAQPNAAQVVKMHSFRNRTLVPFVDHAVSTLVVIRQPVSLAVLRPLPYPTPGGIDEVFDIGNGMVRVGMPETESLGMTAYGTNAAVRVLCDRRRISAATLAKAGWVRRLGESPAFSRLYVGGAGAASLVVSPDNDAAIYATIRRLRPHRGSMAVDVTLRFALHVTSAGVRLRRQFGALTTTAVAKAVEDGIVWMRHLIASIQANEVRRGPERYSAAGLFAA